MSITASVGDPELFGEEDSAALPPSGMVARSREDSYAFLGSREGRTQVETSTRLDDWVLGVDHAGVGPTPVPFFLEVPKELTRSWMSSFTARNRSDSSSSLTTLDGGAAKGYTEIPLVEPLVATQLCTAWSWYRFHLAGQTNPSLPSL